MSLSKNQKIIIAALVMLGMIVGLIRPAVVKLQERLRTRKKLESKVTKLSKKLEILEGIDRVLIEDRVNKMEAVFPSKKPVVSLLASLSQLALEHELLFGGVSLTPGSLSEEIEKARQKNKKVAVNELFDLQFGFQVEGDFDSIVKYMQDLENTAPLMQIDQISLSIKTSPLEDRQKTIVVADISVLAYYQPPPKSLGNIDSPVKLLSKNEEVILNRLFDFETYPAVVPQAQAGKADLFE